MPDLIGTLDVKQSLEITTTSYDTLISTLISAASDIIEQRCQREFIGGTATRVFSVKPAGTGLLVDLAPYDIRESTTPTVVLHPEETATTLTVNRDYMLKPLGGARRGGSYQQIVLSPSLSFTSTLAREFGESALSIAGTWGVWGGTASVDDAVKRGCVLTVSAWMDRAIAELGVDEGGREIRPDRFTTWAIPSAAWSILYPWARVGTP